MNFVVHQDRHIALYLEKFGIWNILVGLLFSPELRLAIKKRTQIFYIDNTITGVRFVLPLCRLFRIQITRLDFRMMDIKDDNGELVRVRIPRRDLFDFQKEIQRSDLYMKLSHETWKADSIKAYIDKGLIDGGIMEKKSVSHMLFIINVIKWHSRRDKNQQVFVIINKRPWKDVYQKYCDPLGLRLLHVPNNPLDSFNKAALKNLIAYFPYVFSLLRSIKYRDKNVTANNDLPKLYLDGRGDINFENNGYHSDFFWLLNSSFKTENLLYQYHSIEEKEVLIQNKINVTNGQASPQLLLGSFVKPEAGRRSSGLEKRLAKSMLVSYVNTRHYWHEFFQQHQVKVHMFWHRFNNYHVAVADAIRDAGGISIYWPVSFDGYPSVECASSSDIIFSYSHFSAELEKQNGASYKYNIITGYPKDYAGKLLKDEAQQLRKRLQKNGAEKIVFVIDENSLDDGRWHTGHQLQRENYSFILEKMLEIPWLGVVFKPKAARTLRQRLGPVAELLKEAEKTGRCFIYETSNRYTTSAPPILAGLSADICIHGHLCAGTAALECALEGLPTLLIDREGMPASKLQELPRGKVIFDDWPSAIEAIMSHFSRHNGIEGFGDWSAILDELDPFRDGLAAYRMGSFLKWLMDCLEQGMSREDVMHIAATKYAQAWGEDKVLVQ